MTLEEFTAKFADCFHQTDSSVITPDTHFKTIEEWGSMMALIVIAMVDSEWGKTLTADTIRNAETVRDLYETLNAS